MELLQVIFPVAGVKTYLFIPPAVAFAISFFTSMAGISGAFLLLPFQMSVLGFTTTSVTSTNFLFNVTGTPGGVYRYIKDDTHHKSKSREGNPEGGLLCQDCHKIHENWTCLSM